MGVKLLVFKDAEPEIAVTFEYVAPGTAKRAQGWHGTCTQCGKPMHFWTEGRAMFAGQVHVDRCE
jgi:hypothetical protein